jgi:hypothetical protein
LDEVDAYVKEAIDHIHSHGGAACATHPHRDYWRDYDYDAIDKEPARPLAGTEVEKNWLDGRNLPFMNSVDLYGPRRAVDDPAINFLYLKGAVPCRDSVVKAIRSGNIIAAAGFHEADICLGDYVPGDYVSKEEAAKSTLTIHAQTRRGPIRQVRVYSGPDLVYTHDGNEEGMVDLSLPMAGIPLDRYVRVEIEGMNHHWICISTPFYLK